MFAHSALWISRRKRLLLAVGVPLIVAAWWAFRPEKLWINEKVSEPAPFGSASDPQALYTGRFESHMSQTSGRATVYREPDGKLSLRLTDFSTANVTDAHVILAEKSGKGEVQMVIQSSVDLGSLKSVRGDQEYDLPASVDLKNYTAVVIYAERSHSNDGIARLEPF